MALVIFCVAFVAAMRLRRSLSDGIRGSIYCDALTRKSFSAMSLREGFGEAFDRALELARGRVVEIARIADGVEDVAVLAVQHASRPSSKARTRLTGSGS